MLNVETKRNCFVFDLDGTLCDVRHRRQYVATKPRNWDAWNKGLVNDVPNLAVQKVFQALRNCNDYETDLIIVSGRSDDYKEQTIKWLTDRQRVVNMWIERGIWVFDVGQGKGQF
jgi:hypothetical protein